MKAVKITCVGKLKEKYFAAAADEYIKRLSRFCRVEICELDDVPYSDEAARESDAILKTFRPDEYVILADIGGELYSSEELSRILENAYTSGKSAVRFVIGGSAGVDERVRKSADKRISFGRMTYPHQLMRVMLLEQVYRAFTIAAGMPYHK